MSFGRHGSFWPLAILVIVAQPLPVGAQPTISISENELCNFDFASQSGAKAEADTDNMRLRAEAEGAASGVTARAAYGVEFVADVSFPAIVSVKAPYQGRLQDNGAPTSHYRIEMVLVDMDAGAEVAQTTIAFDEKPPPFGPANNVFNPFGAGIINFDLIGGTEYRVMIELEVHSNGLASNSDFFDGDRGVSTSCVTVAPDLVDTDGDAIFDDWETSGIDVDGGGNDLDTTDLGLDFRGVPIVLDPMRKDVLVEIDYFDCNVAGGDCPAGDVHRHRPNIDALEEVVEAFANAQEVDNPDGTKGVNLWIVLDQALPHQMVCDLDATCFDVVKAANLGPVESQGDAAEATARRLIFHYNLWVHTKTASPPFSTGESDGGCDNGNTPKWGDDFVVSLGGRSDQMGSRSDHGGTFMHELGHNLGLCHGGQDEDNCKPNYQSVMSYAFQTRGLLPTGAFDYSHEALPDLDETALNENVGIQNGGLWTWFGPRRDIDGDGTLDWLFGIGNGPVNWNWNFTPGGAPTIENNVSADINNLGMRGCQASAGDTLAGANDWENLIFDFRNSEFYPSGHAPGADDELTSDDFDAIAEATYWQRRNPKFGYGAKLVCGLQGAEDVLRLTRGMYGTTVNVRNVGRREAEVEKGLTLAFPPAEQRPGNRYRIALDQIPPGHAIKVDCDDIRERLFPDGFPESYVEGFITLESDERLQVVGVYTVSSVNESGRIVGGSSIDIETAGERDLRTDLKVEKTSLVYPIPLAGPDFLAQFRLFAVLYTVRVSNQGKAYEEGVEISDAVTLAVTGPTAGVIFVPDDPLEIPEGAEIGPITNDPVPPAARFSVTVPEIAPDDTVEVRFWTLALVYLSSPQDPLSGASLINRVEVAGTGPELTLINNKAETVDQLVE